MTELSLVEVGRLGKSYGFKGDIHLYINDHIEIDQNPSFLFLDVNGLPVPMKVIRVGEHNGTMTVAFDMVETKEDVEQYKNGLVSMESSQVIIILNQSTLYINCEVYDQTNAHIGKVTDVIDQSPLLLLQVYSVENKKTYVLPYHEDLLIEYQEKDQILKIDIAEGLLDL